MSNRFIHHLFEEKSKEEPNAIAVIDDQQALTYQQLNDKAERLAASLRNLGVKKNIPVGIYAKSSLFTIMGVMGILKADGLYVPVNPEPPLQIFQFILSDTQMPFLLTTKSLIDSIHCQKSDVIPLSDDWIAISFPKTAALQPINYSTHLAYILYTSGTTGKPKGVLVSHENLISTYRGWEEIYKLKTQKMNHLQMANFAFDVFTGDWVRALCSGGKLILCSNEVLLNPEKLYKLIVQQQVNCAEFVPSVLRKLIYYLEITKKRLDFMKILICGSDSWTVGEYKKFKQYCATTTRLINSYGLTEATIDSTFFECADINTLMLDDQQLVPIGQAFPHVRIYILDDSLQLVEKKDSGEIYIGGPAVSCGYLNQPELTAEKFIKNPFTASFSQDKLLKTGDLGKLIDDRNIAFLGRKDTQTKINGCLIELSAIEAALNEHPAIQESLIAVKKIDLHHEHLFAWLVLKKEFSLTHQEAQNFLKEKLPPHMIPKHYFQIDSIPLTTNGKIDRKASPPFNKLPSKFFS